MDSNTKTIGKHFVLFQTNFWGAYAKRQYRRLLLAKVLWRRVQSIFQRFTSGARGNSAAKLPSSDDMQSPLFNM